MKTKTKLTLLFLILTGLVVTAQLQKPRTIIADPSFEQALKNDGYDGSVATDSISKIKTLNISNLGIKNLTGIQDFTALTNLNCYKNELINLDLSDNKDLIYLNCNTNKLTHLIVNKNSRLNHLSCYKNNLTELNVSDNRRLRFLSCYSNNLFDLNLNNNKVLKTLACNDNKIKNLSLTNNKALTYYILSKKLIN